MLQYITQTDTRCGSGSRRAVSPFLIRRFTI